MKSEFFRLLVTYDLHGINTSTLKYTNYIIGIITMTNKMLLCLP